MNTKGSYWLRGAERTYPPLASDAEADVCIVGAGLVGATVAALLAEQGLRTVVLERSAVGSGTTGHTTGKVTSGHGAIYSTLEQERGADVAARYARSNEEGLSLVRSLVSEYGISCDLEDKENYVYASDPQNVSKIAEEVQAARRAGLNVELVETLDLPFEIAAAVRLTDQAQFDAAAYVSGLAAAASERGVAIHEDTRVTSVSPGGDEQTVETEGGHVVRAAHVVLADHYPLLDRAILFPRVYPQRSYCVAGPVADPAALPRHMYISHGEPTRSLRTTSSTDGPLLIVGGEGHAVGREADTESSYSALETWAAEHFGMTPIYRWSAQDGSTPDGVPYVGRYRHGAQIYVATGFGKWGLTNGTIGSRTIVDQILGREAEFASLFDPARMEIKASAQKLITENTKVAFHFVRDRLAHPQSGSLEDLEPGEAAVADKAFAPVAGYRDEAGVLHKVSAVCTHLGCTVAWNGAEKSWDCPCHGSRFDVEGRVLEGPATRDLERLDED